MNCPICLENFLEPQILNCGHSYCLRCIISLQQHSPRTASCPECRQRIIRYTSNYSLNNQQNNQENTNEISVQNKMNIDTKKKICNT